MAESTLAGPASAPAAIDHLTPAPGAKRQEQAAPAYPRRRLFTVVEFERMADVGILTDQERVELIEGEIIEMSRIGSPHSACTTRLIRLFRPVEDGAMIRSQDPIKLGETSEPEPDLSIARLKDDAYESGHPTPADLFLVIEVMDTSADYDRKVKLPLYARSGIAETWLVDLEGGFIEVHRRPMGGQYSEKQTFSRGQTVSPEAFPDLVLAVDSILSRAEA